MIRIMVVALALLLGACGNYVETEVRTLQNLQGSVSGKTFMMVPDDSRANDLEWQHYAGMVAARLQGKGMRRMTPGPGADYAIFIKYGRTAGETSVSSVPIFGQTGGGTTSTTTGYIGRTPVSGSTYTPPTFGVVGVGTQQTTTYGRAVGIQMIDMAQSKATGTLVTVYDGRAISTGESGNLMAVMPYMIDAIFIDWPAPNGSTITRRVSMK